MGIGALVAAAAAVATGARARRAASLDRADRAAAEERLRMAQDLHDGVGHGLAVIAMQAGVALHVLDQDPAKARASLEAIRTTSRESLEALRSELAVMSGERPSPARAGAGRPARTARPGARRPGCASKCQAIPAKCRAWSARCRTSSSRSHSPTCCGTPGAGSVTVGWVRGGDRLELTVRDDGRGGAVQDEGMGISGMRARVARLGGSLRAGARAGGGFEVVAELPV